MDNDLLDKTTFSGAKKVNDDFDSLFIGQWLVHFPNTRLSLTSGSQEKNGNSKTDETFYFTISNTKNIPRSFRELLSNSSQCCWLNTTRLIPFARDERVK